MTTHLAAVVPQLGGPLAVVSRPTPSPGPKEILIDIKAVALNSVDCKQRDAGIPNVVAYPHIAGCDAAGIVAAVGRDVRSSLTVGSKVIGLVSSFFHLGNSDYGAFQKLALVDADAVVALPDNLSFEEGAALPLGVMTALTAWTTIGISLDTRYAVADKQAVLIWGASSSTGTYAVQTAKTLGFRVYATASARHHERMKKLGADAVFDYADSDVVEQIVRAVKADGVKLHTAHAVVAGVLQPVLDVLKQTKGDHHAKVAHSPVLLDGHPTLDDTTILFTFPDLDEAKRTQHTHKVYQEWLAEGLKTGSIVPGPKIQPEEGGLGGLNSALDKLNAGVSCTKIVVSIDK